MLYRLGQSLQAHGAANASALTAQLFTLTATLPSEFTYTRGDAVSTIRDSNGDWQAASANQPLFDHDASGNALGLRFEPARVNKVNHYNFAPTTIGNISRSSGDGVSSIVDDSAKLASATIDGATFTDLSNGNAVSLTGGTGGSNFELSVTTGNTNPHSFRVVARTGTTGYHGNVRLNGTGTPGLTTFNATGNYEEIVQENLIPASTGVKLQVYVPAGMTVYIAAAQMEEGEFITSPIISTVNDGTAARAHPVCVDSAADTRAYFNNDQGAIIVDCTFAALSQSDDQYIAMATEGTGLTNTMALYLETATGQARARAMIAGVSEHNEDIHKPIANRRFPMAISWKNGRSIAAAGSMRYKDVSYSGNVSGMNRIYIGGRPFADTFNGWIKSVKIYNGYRNLNYLGAEMFPSDKSYTAIACGGQSNKDGFFRSVVGYGNQGEAQALSIMDGVYSSTENWMINGAKGGSALFPDNDTGNGYWYDPDTQSFGTCMEYWENAVTAFGVSNIVAIDWDHGESDVTENITDLKAGYLAVFNRMREVVGEVPVFITNIGRRADYQDTNYNTMRQAIWDLASENSWIHLMPEKFAFALADNVHLTDAAYGDFAQIHMRRLLAVLGESITGGTIPPFITGASRSGNDVSVTLGITAGTDFTPSSNIAGFHFFDDEVEIPITTAVRTNASTITLTLNSTPSGVETLYYGYGSLYGEAATYTNLVRDNSTYALPLWASIIAL